MVLGAYVLGTIPFGLLVPKLFGVSDIRQHGSGNIGATNVWRTLGFKVAIWVFIGDIGKGVLAVLLASWVALSWANLTIPVESLLVIAGVAAIIGHIFPFYLHFKGGKGVNTALGVMVTLLPVYAVIALLVFLGILGIFRFVSLASMIAAVSLFVSVLCGRFLFHQTVPLLYIIVAFFVAGVVIYAHRANISRLLQGTEYRVSFAGKNKGKGNT